MSYQFLHSGLPYTAFAGDWLFTRSLYGDRPESDAAYVRDGPAPERGGCDADQIARIVAAPRLLRPFPRPLHGDPAPCRSRRRSASPPRSSRTFPSLALARADQVGLPGEGHRVRWRELGGGDGRGAPRARSPSSTTSAPARPTSPFPALVQRVAAGRDGDRRPRRRLPQSAASRRRRRHRHRSRNLDTLPIPDYDDYIDALASSPAAADVTPMLMLETSRGCWWGEKHHCTFCGLNGLTMAFRSKTPERVIEEIETLRSRYGARVHERGRQHPGHALLRHPVADAGGAAGAPLSVLRSESEPDTRSRRPTRRGRGSTTSQPGHREPERPCPEL